MYATDGSFLTSDISLAVMTGVYRRTVDWRAIEDMLAYPHLKTEVLAASVRHPVHLLQCAKLGAHVATLPPNVIRALVKHPLTDKGLEGFMADWKKTGQSIL